MAEERLEQRVAVVGLGEAAWKIHLPAIARLPELKLVGACDPDPEARERYRRSRLGGHASSDAPSLLADTRPDWAVVVTPPSTHLSLCLAALDAGCNVFCEKPFTVNVEEADRVLAAAERAGRVVVVNHEFPRMPIFEALIAEVGSARFGRPLFLQVWETMHYPPQEERGWRSTGTTMREFGTHVVDLAMTIFGAAPERVYARMPDPTGVPGADPIDVVTLDFPGERTACIVIDRVSRGVRRYLDLRLDGEAASVRASIGGRAALRFWLPPGKRLPRVRFELAAGGQAWIENGDRRRVLARNPLDAFADATAKHFREAVEAVAAGRVPAGSGTTARGVVAVVAAAYESARLGQPVVPNPEGGRPRSSTLTDPDA